MYMFKKYTQKHMTNGYCEYCRVNNFEDTTF